MSQLVPRQGIFAIVLLASFCLHALLLVFSTEKAQHDYRAAKGTQIVNQLSQEAQMAMASKDRVSLSVIANRYQTDSDVAKLVISDADNQLLVQTGQALLQSEQGQSEQGQFAQSSTAPSATPQQRQTGEVIDKVIVQDKQPLGHLSVTMRAVSKGEIISKLWPFLLGSAILHGFLLLLYSLLARPTKAQIHQLGEEIQHKLTHQYALAGQALPAHLQPKPTVAAESDTSLMENPAPENKDAPQSAITRFLQTTPQEGSQKSETTSNDARFNTGTQIAGDTAMDKKPSLTITMPPSTAPLTTAIVGSATAPLATTVPPTAVNSTNTDIVNPSAAPVTPMGTQTPIPTTTQAMLQFQFFDEYKLLDKLAPELATPYLQLCEDLLQRACDHLLTQNPTLIARQLNSIQIMNTPHFTHEGALVTLMGRPDQLALASVLLGKLVIILNQIVYEKHRELGRFALPLRVGASSTPKAPDMQKLLLNHAKADSLLLLFSQDYLKSLEGQVQLKNQTRPTNVYEREMVWYDGMAENLITTLIEKRNQILSFSQD